MPIAVVGTALLVVAGTGLFYYASQTAIGPERGDVHKVVVGQKICDPADFTLPAGRTTFEIHNASDRPIEWEILDGLMVVEERENIAPGFHSLLTAKLKPGAYEITCGLLSNPRGTLTVTPSAESEAEQAAPPITAFIGPLSEFKVFLVVQSSALVKETEKLADAIRAGDLEEARAVWLAARLPYKRMEAVTGRIADLENTMDPLSDYLEKREEDPAFTGFHRIEYGLWGLKGNITMALNRLHLAQALHLLDNDSSKETSSDRFEGEPIVTSIPAHFIRDGKQVRLVLGEVTTQDRLPDPDLIRLITNAHHWFEDLRTGKAATIAEMAERDRVPAVHISRTLPLAFLAPDIIEMIISGRQPPTLTSDRLKRRQSLPLLWPEQREVLS